MSSATSRPWRQASAASLADSTGPIRWRSKRTRWPASITRPSAALAAPPTHLDRAFVHRQHCLCALASDAEGGTQRAHQALFGAHQERPRRLAPIRRGAEVDLSAIQAQQALAGVVAHVQRAVGVHLDLAAVLQHQVAPLADGSEVSAPKPSRQTWARHPHQTSGAPPSSRARPRRTARRPLPDGRSSARRASAGGSEPIFASRRSARRQARWCSGCASARTPARPAAPEPAAPPASAAARRRSP